ncbi:MAG: hypothetical protein U5M23_12980 [Marinagarivorans sp.]|nr:hypothetical protein [Marinagarivorans sp.]
MTTLITSFYRSQVLDPYLGLPWDSGAAAAYASLRTACENEGKPLGAMDMLIAAHSVAAETVLITNDKAFYNVQHLLSLEDWTKPIEH